MWQVSKSSCRIRISSKKLGHTLREKYPLTLRILLKERVQFYGSIVRQGFVGYIRFAACYFYFCRLDLFLQYEGEQHRRQRKMINPSFSIAHMRHMSKDS